MADKAVKTGKVAIQDPSDFYAWTQSSHCHMRSVQFIFVSAKSCQEKASEVAKVILWPIVGTMKLHAVAGKGNLLVSVCNTSCYCDICMSESFTCETWRDESLATTQQVSMPNIMPLGKSKHMLVVNLDDIKHIEEHLSTR